MTFKQFKKITFDYFINHSFLKKRVLKKALKYKIVSQNNSLGDHCEVVFMFKEHELKLDYWLNIWDLTMETSKGREICNRGKTIEQCCDYLWKIGEKKWDKKVKKEKKEHYKG